MVRRTPHLPAPHSRGTRSISSLEFVKKHLISLTISLASLFLLFAAVGFIFKERLEFFSTWLYESYGFVAVGAWVFVCDFIYGPMTVGLLVVSKPPLLENWAWYVFLLCGFSLAGGHAGYWSMYFLARRKWLPRGLRMLPYRYKSEARKYGPLLVIAGAGGPLPFSLCSWTAGLLKMPYGAFTLATLFRIPRMYVTYLGITGSLQMMDWMF